jgi:sensor histidine kinase YesM
MTQAWERRYWYCQLAGWGIWFCIYSSTLLLSPRRTIPVAAVAFMALSGLGASHVLRLVVRRRGYMALPPGSLVPRLLALILMLAAALTGLNLLAMLYAFRVFTWSQTSLVGYVFTYGTWSALLSGWVAIYVAVHYFDRHRRSELEKLRLEILSRDAQLGALRAQLNPHFMFNCLNSIRALVAENPERAQSAITELSNLLRRSLQAERLPLVTLREEMETVSEYLRLESLRYEQRLQVETAIDGASLDRRVPPLLVQTLVENAIKHGIARSPQGGVLRIEAVCQGGELQLQVVNTGTIAEAARDGGGTGLSNARRRLAILFGETASLALRTTAQGQVVAELRIAQGAA